MLNNNADSRKSIVGNHAERRESGMAAESEEIER